MLESEGGGAMAENENRTGLFERFSVLVTDWSARSEAILGALLVIIVWGVLGPLLHYSDTWQLVINTLTSLVTFMMVFLIQRAQNKSSLAIQLKLNEIIAAMRGASNRMIAVEELSEDDLRRLHTRFQQLAGLAQDETRRKAVYSVEEADQAQALMGQDDPQAAARARRLAPGEKP